MSRRAEAVNLLKQHLEGLRETGTESVLDFRLKPRAVKAAVKSQGVPVTAVSPAPVPAASYASLTEMERAIRKCVQCPLGRSRNTFVFGEGDPKAELVFVGEAPGAEEDKQGRPFVGDAGQLLTKIIEAMDMKREDVFICNILKCRPPGNRDPLPGEVEQCFPYLDQQLALIRPKVICALGNHAAQNLLRSPRAIGQLRGRVHERQGVRVVPTYHPAACLYNPDNKKYVWQDMKLIMEILKRDKGQV